MVRRSALGVALVLGLHLALHNPAGAALSAGFTALERDAIARVAFAEAGNQGDSGLAGVVYVILNRLKSGQWGASVDAVLNAPHQFEPVLRAGGDWRRLRRPSEVEQARIDTILNLARDGRLPDLTIGASFFQNPKVVAARAALGQVSAGLINFGGVRPSALIGGHAFYVTTGKGRGARSPASRATERVIFAGEPNVGDHGSLTPEIAGAGSANDPIFVTDRDPHALAGSR